MDAEDINYKNLRRIQQLEKNSPLPTKIDSNFYQNLSSYLKTLEKMAEKEENQQKIKLIKEELQNTKKIADNVYELREKKIVQAALSTVRGGKPDLKNLIEPEKKLFNTLVDQIIASRKTIFEKKSEEIKEDKVKPKEETEEKKTNDNPIVRVTKDIPEFVGTDMKTYSLRKEDVLSISKEMSEPLLKRGVVKQIK
jgi:DNA replication initiation complex subunit (GINS family)